ncbi:ComEC/Rec2 family competence protein [Candidatus Daviesbacteria bacterium]|nr:ComEC/Rec2 family competence protein [Candidatus Daviesbacteria bacterium]
MSLRANKVSVAIFNGSGRPVVLGGVERLLRRFAPRNDETVLPIILAILLYLLIYFLRWQQGGWNPEIDIFKEQRLYLDQKISKILPSPQSELLSGIMLGQNKELPASLRLALRDTSTLHIVVASGQNLSMVAGFFLAFSGLIKRKYVLLLGFGAALIYTILSGTQVPIVRAMIMFTFSSAAQIFGRQRDGVWVLIVTAGLMLLVNPAWILDLSFQLSFLATLGVVAVAPILLKYLKILPVVNQDLAITLGAQLLVMPVIIQKFHQLSLVSVFTNLLIGWTVPFIMISGLAMIAVSLISSTLAAFAGLIVGAFLNYFIYIVQFFASLPFAWEYVGEQWWVVWVGYYLLVGGILLGISKSKLKS